MLPPGGPASRPGAESPSKAEREQLYHHVITKVSWVTFWALLRACYSAFKTWGGAKEPVEHTHDAVPLHVLLHLWLFLSAVNVFDLSTAYENALYSMIDGQDVVLLEFA